MRRGRYDQRRAKDCLDFECFIRERTCWRRSHEYVEELWWTAAEIHQALRGAGFRRVQSWDARTFSRQHQSGCRTFYLAQLAPREKRSLRASRLLE